MILVQNRDGGYLVGPFLDDKEADRYIKLMPFPSDWDTIIVDEPDWDDFE